MKSFFGLLLLSSVRSRLQQIFLVSFCIIIFPVNAMAGTLTMVGDGGLEVTELKSQPDGGVKEYRIKGTYSIENRGDEVGKEVFPQFRIGQWQWSGEPKSLPPGQKAEWEVDAVISEDKLDCRSTESCGELELPVRGAYPLYILRHYQDLNGYRFSAPDISRVTIGELSSEETDRIQVPSIEASMTLEHSSGNEFETALTILNMGDEQVKLALSQHHSREIRPTAEVPLITVEPNGKKRTLVTWENFKGLEGSAYATFLVLHWDAGGVRTFVPAGAILSIHRAAKTPYFLWGSIAALIVFGAVLWLAVKRPRRTGS